MTFSFYPSLIAQPLEVKIDAASTPSRLPENIDEDGQGER